MNELQRLPHSRQWLFFLKWIAPIVFVNLVIHFSGTKVDVTKFSQILLIYSEAIKTVFYFLKTSQVFSNIFPIRQTALTSSKPWMHSWRERVPSSYFSQYNQSDKRSANATLLKQEYAAGSTLRLASTHTAMDWDQYSSRKYTPWYNFHVFVVKIKYSFKYLPRQPWWVCFISLPTVINRKLLASPRLCGPILPQQKTATTDYLYTITFV